MPKPTVLAVDDTPANLLAVEAVLDKDFEVIRASSGPEAIELLRRGGAVDVILMDLQMPGMDGFDAARRIKQLEGCQEIPIVFITAVYTEDPHVKEGYAAGGVDYFTKPFDPALLRLKLGIYASFRQRAAVLKERERQLKETEELLAAGRKLSGLLETLPVGVLIADLEGRICQSNDEVSRICESAELIKNDAYGTMLDWWDASGSLFKDRGGPLTRALVGKSTHREVMQLRTLRGTTKPIVMSASPLYGLDGEIVGAVIVLQDASEPRRIEGELEGRITKLVSLGVELQQSIRD